jgi:type II secretory pathway pseudopilin PulG
MKRSSREGIERTARTAVCKTTRRSDNGDTLVEVLLALVILGMASVALLIAFSASISSSAEHRKLAAYDTVLATASQEVIAQIQNTSTLFTDACDKSAPLTAPIVSNYGYYGASGVTLPAPYAGTYNVQYVNTTPTSVTTATPAIQYWNGTSYQTSCLTNAPQLITIGISGTTYTNSFVVEYPIGSSNGSVGSGTAAQLIWDQQPSSGVLPSSALVYAGSPFPQQPIIEVDTSGSSQVTTDFSPVTFAITYPLQTSATLSGCQGNEILGVVTFSGCTISAGGTYQITAYDGNLTSAASQNIIVQSSKYKLVFSGEPKAGPSGSTFQTSPTVQVQNSFGVVDKTWSGTITLTISGGQLTNCPGSTATTYTLTPSSELTLGSWSLPATCDFSGGYFYNPNSSPQITASQYTMMATANPTVASDAAVPALSNAFSVSSFGTATQLAFSTEPTGVASSSQTAAFSGQPSVTVEDAFGNVVTNASNTLTMTMWMGATSETLQNCSSSFSEGTYTYRNCHGTAWNTGLTLKVTSGSLSPATSTPFNITNVATKLLFLTSPVAGASGSAFSIQPTLVFEDSANRVVTAMTTPVTFQSSPFQSSPASGALSTCTGLAPNLGYVNVANCTFTGLVGTQYTLTATAGALVSLPSASFSPTAPGAASQLVFTAEPIAGASGAPFTTQPIVSVEDVAGNVVTSSAAYITFSTSSGTLSFCPGLTASAGVINTSGCTFAGVVGTPYTVTASSATLPDVTSSTFKLTGPGVASQVVLSGCPLSITATSSCTETAVLEDSYGNIETSDNSSVITFAQISGSGSVTGLTSATASGGAAHVILTATGSGSVTLDATADSLTSNPFTMTVNAVPTVTTTSLAVATDTETGYSQTLTGTGGTTPYAWTVTTGTLPTGLTLNPSTGAITGTLGSSASSQTFTVTLTDVDGVTATRSLTLTVDAAPNITTTSLPGATRTGSYSQSLSVTGGMSPITWSVSTGTLPTGLTLNPSTGVISGTPTGSTAIFTVKATDANGASDTQQLTLTVAAVPSITPTSIAVATDTQTAYSQALTVNGGTTPFGSWSISAGVLPSGLTLNPSTGAITGTVGSAATTQIFTVRITDVNGVSGIQQLTLTVNAAPVITTTVLPAATITGHYSWSVAVSGGTMPMNWSLLTGTLPAGLTLSPTTGVISGTVSSGAVNSTFTVKVIDANAVSTTQSLTLTINAAPTINAILLATATDNENGYLQTLTGTGGTPAYAWTVTTGTLPSGLTLSSSTGAITGTLGGLASSQTFTVTLTDANGVTATRSLTLTVNGATKITTTLLPGATMTGAYSQTPQFTGGTPPIAWSLSSGILPLGLAMNPSTGAITGTVSTSAVNETFVIKATDANGVSDSKSLSIAVNAAPTINAISLATATDTETGYSQTLTGTGGTTAYAWAVTTGILPTGLTLNSSTGSITGTLASSASSQTFTVTLTDANGVTTTRSLTLTVYAAPSITPTTLPGGPKGTAYSQTLTASGGTGSYTWSYTGNLPTGLNQTAGVISGNPSKKGNYSFTVIVTDANGVSASQVFTITIS